MRACALILLSCAAAAAQGTFDVGPLKQDADRDARIAELIEALKGIDQPHDGITCWSGGGVGFDAYDDDAPPAFRELVRFGPAAIPALLDHLTDRRRTRLGFRHDPEATYESSIFPLPEVPAGDPEELARIRRVLGVKAIKDGPCDLDLTGRRIDDYTVTVGDCCYVILGQIVNRSYEAVRYQPTMIILVSSPTEEPGIAKILRGRWGRADPRQLLAESLLADFRRKRRGAELRLLTYFPEQGGPVVARRVAGLYWGDRGDMWDRNGLDAYDLLGHTVQTGNPLIRAEWLKLLDPARPRAAQLAALEAAPPDPGDDGRERIRAILARTMDAELLLAGVRALPGPKPDDLRRRLETNLAAAHELDRREAQRTLAALVLVGDERSVPLFRAHMERLGDDGRETVLSALAEDPRSGLARALLPSLLEATAPFRGLPGVPEPGWMRKGETRLCDWAAHIATQVRPDLAFDRDAPIEERDRQIAAIRAALAK